MEKKTYEILTDTFPAHRPRGAGATIELTEAEARYLLLSGEIRLAATRGDTPPAEAKPKGGRGRTPGPEGEGA